MIYFVTGIDTDIGKTYVTASIAKYLLANGKKVITQKLVQTGNHIEDISEDIIKHRELMGIGLQEVDIDKTTCNQIFELPSSPHLASSLENRMIDFDAILNSTNILKEKFEYLLIEGAGGVMVPLTLDKLTIDYIKDFDYETILVTSPKLGSLNHTILTIEAMRNRDIKLKMVVYNAFINEDKHIEEDSFKMIRKYLDKYNYNDVKIVKLAKFDSDIEADFGDLIV